MRGTCWECGIAWWRTTCTHWRNWISRPGYPAAGAVSHGKPVANNLLHLFCLAWCWMSVYLYCGKSQTATGESIPNARLPCLAHHLSDACPAWPSVTADQTWMTRSSLQTRTAVTSSCAMKAVGSSAADPVSCSSLSACQLLASHLRASSSLCTTRRFPSGLALSHSPPATTRRFPSARPPPGQPVYWRFCPFPLGITRASIGGTRQESLGSAQTSQSGPPGALSLLGSWLLAARIALLEEGLQG